ncbi:hypothetical protein HK405_005175 [Cladochytrium tenue]|nr:hypothetical protein HK405_005175 [Cladochytrium tenue]
MATATIHGVVGDGPNKLDILWVGDGSLLPPPPSDGSAPLPPEAVEVLAQNANLRAQVASLRLRVDGLQAEVDRLREQERRRDEHGAAAGNNVAALRQVDLIRQAAAEMYGYFGIPDPARAAEKRVAELETLLRASGFDPQAREDGTSSEATAYDPLSYSPEASRVSACGWDDSVEERYDFFISYRVASDSKLALELYLWLERQMIRDAAGKVRPVRVFLDQRCLKKGQLWRDGFTQGLKNSRCVLMLVSSGALRRMSSSDFEVDSVLIEWETAILAGKRKLCVPQPVFVNRDGFKISDVVNGPFPRSAPPQSSDGQRLSARTTLSLIMQLEGFWIDPEHVDWCLADCMAALGTYDTLAAEHAKAVENARETATRLAGSVLDQADRVLHCRRNQDLVDLGDRLFPYYDALFKENAFVDAGIVLAVLTWLLF